jgi:transposase
MAEAIMVGADVHDKTILLRVAVDRGPAITRSYPNTAQGRQQMMAWLKAEGGRVEAEVIYLAYEASSAGYGLYDRLTEAGIDCAVLAPTKIARSPKHAKRKTDERDGERLLDLVRGALLAGIRLPAIWVPDPQTRDDREVVRARLDLTEKATAVKAQVQMLLKRQDVRKPAGMGRSWTKGHRAWLGGLTLQSGARIALESLLRQLAAIEAEIEALDGAIGGLAAQPRYRAMVEALVAGFQGVQTLTAMVFLTEMGNVDRFANRRQVGAYLGLVPTSAESGEADERKGHITRQGPARVRKVLCQSVHVELGCSEAARTRRERIAGGKGKGRKIATVALMRQKAVRMWRVAKVARAGAPEIGRTGPGAPEPSVPPDPLPSLHQTSRRRSRERVGRRDRRCAG